MEKAVKKGEATYKAAHARIAREARTSFFMNTNPRRKRCLP
jgi:hypothetical protein